ncbi:ABC transporter permease [Acidobacteriota bacterium]
MFKNYIKITLRAIKRHTGFSLINLFGLALGMACCVLILLFVQSELSYDRFHENSDRIYRVTREWLNEDGTSSLHLGHVAPPIAPLLLNDFPELLHAVRIQKTSLLCSYENKHFVEDDLLIADWDFFKVFSFPLIVGNPETALKDPFSVVITQKIAKKYFGDEDPIGKTLMLDSRISARVSGVISDAPYNSHFHYDLIVSMSSLIKLYGQNEFQSWSSNNYATYLLFPEDYSAQRLENKLPTFLDKHQGENAHKRNILHLQSLSSIHLHSHLDSEVEGNSDITYVYVFSAIAIFILLIACINFMNLSTARSSIRAKEIGMRKVVGAYRSQVIRQFLSESVILAFIALVLALVMVWITLPSFSRFVVRDLSLNILQNPSLLLGLLGISLFVGFVSGSYPAFYLSSFRPVTVLKGSRGQKSHGSIFRTALVVFQFIISVILIISVGVVQKQLKYSQDRRLGFNKDQVVVLPETSAMRGKHEDIRNQLLSNPSIIGVTGSRRVPSGRLLDSAGSRVISGNSLQPITFRIAYVCVDYDFFSTYEMELAAGRDFSREYSTDASEGFILNETAVQRIGWTAEEAIGQTFQYGRRKGRVVGVMKDFHFESLHQQISPMVFYISPSDYRQMSVRLSPDNIPAVLAFLERKWAEYQPNYPFSYSFIDERFEQLYQTEQRLGQIIRAFSVLAIIIACLGLFGLAAFTAEHRTKEIGIRKVMGASVLNLIFLLTSQYTRWVLLANLIAWPLAYFLMKTWLQSFAYRTSISVGVFLASGIAAVVIAILTVSYQSIKAALSNPVDTLHYE